MKMAHGDVHNDGDVDDVDRKTVTVPFRHFISSRQPFVTRVVGRGYLFRILYVPYNNIAG